MSAETTTADLTHAVRAAPVVVKAQARVGIPVLVTLAAAGYAWLIHMAGVW